MTEEQLLVHNMNHHLKALKDQGGFGPLMQSSVEFGLMMLAENQKQVSAAIPGCIPAAGELPSKDAIRSYTLALFVELGEFLQELDWKPWKNKTNVDKQNVALEFADILAFLGVMIVQLNALGITSKELSCAYQAKSIVNLERFLGVHDNAYAQVKQDLPKFTEVTDIPPEPTQLNLFSSEEYK